MSMDLYRHNQTAYDAAIQLLEETGRTAVIHPTGTGKSFIAFRLAEDHPQAHICWLAPSQYIFQSQRESYERAAGMPVPGNIFFCTYAGLAMMRAEEMSKIQADYIVLDEFHRYGAAEWGSGVKALLKQCPSARILGLSATHIRYLDNQRNIADELFGGSIASEMTLSEAIEQNILPTPKYIISLYACQKELDRYYRRIQRANGAVQQAAEKYLEALHRALDRAEGLDEIFKKHMPDHHGKYLVFCANREHLKEMLNKVPEWFSGVDPHPHVYSVYAESAESKAAFNRFTEDRSDHLKLLFCINMLNEGVHVRDVNGVILLRPTISPIVYKQQIGRALSASAGKTPVIFDVVNNFENLYSISAVSQSLREAVSLCQSAHPRDEIIKENFEIIDRVCECRELFNRLEETLGASWDMMYQQAEIYYRKNGHLNVPKRYRTESNLSLGAWLATQRKVRKGLCGGILSEAQIAKLDAIGMIWDNRQNLRWEEGYAHARTYYLANGDLDVPTGHVTEGGFALGQWIGNMRQMKNDAKRRGGLWEERIRRLDEIGMIWRHADFIFDRNCRAAAAYYHRHGNLQMPADYVSEDGVRLGAWLNQLRERRHGKEGTAPLTEEQIRRLDQMGMTWDKKFDAQWEKAYAEAQKWYAAHGNLEVPTAHVSGGIRLGRWIFRQREMMESGRLTPERRARLEAIGMIWRHEDSWERNFREAAAYYAGHGDLEVPADFVDRNGSWLGRWIAAQRKDGREGRLTSRQVARLESIGMRWQSIPELQWDRMYEQVKQYMQEHPDPELLSRDAAHMQLSRWYKRQRIKQRDGKLTWQQAKRLEALGL